jgi:hypothetical protein
MSKIEPAQTAARGVPKTPPSGIAWRSERSTVARAQGLCKPQASSFFPHPVVETPCPATAWDQPYSVARISTSHPLGMIRKNSRMSVSRIRIQPLEAIFPMVVGSGVPWAPNPVYEAWVNLTK